MSKHLRSILLIILAVVAVLLIVERVVQLRHEEVVLEDDLTERAAHEPGVLPPPVRSVVALPLQKIPVTESDGETIRFG